LCTIEWQSLAVDLGYEIPDMIREAGLDGPFEESLQRSRDLFNELRTELPHQAQYAVALAFKIRYVIQMNAREAMHLIELRSGPQGHPSYRKVAHEMARLIRDQAGHRGIAESMEFIDFSDTDLERLEAERAAERARTQRS
jgi:thymidylate synthase ThyX